MRFVRAARMMSLLLQLQVRGELTGAELARLLEVSERTVQRDARALADAGIPVRATRGPAGGYRLGGGYRTRLTGIGLDEAGALAFLGLGAPAEQLGLGDLVEGLQTKIWAALTTEARESAQRTAERFHLDQVRWFARPEPVPCLGPLAVARLGRSPRSARLRQGRGHHQPHGGPARSRAGLGRVVPRGAPSRPAAHLPGLARPRRPPARPARPATARLRPGRDLALDPTRARGRAQRGRRDGASPGPVAARPAARAARQRAGDDAEPDQRRTSSSSPSPSRARTGPSSPSSASAAGSRCVAPAWIRQRVAEQSLAAADHYRQPPG